MSDKDDFTDEEWRVVSEAPLLISLAMEAVGPHGPISLVKESAASAKAISQPPDHGPANTIIAQIALAARGKEARQDAKHHKAPTIPTMVDALLDDLAPANIALAKLPADEAAGVRAWFGDIAEAIASAAKQVSPEEQKVIDRIRAIFT